MPKHSETRRLPYAPEQMFDLVADVASYPEFLPWVSAARVRRVSATESSADLVIGFSGISEKFTSRIIKARPERIRVEYVDGPLKFLRNDWTFVSDGAGGCMLGFCVDFAFRSRILDAVAGQVFDRALRHMIAAFEARAGQLYGGEKAILGMSKSSAHKAA